MPLTPTPPSSFWDYSAPQLQLDMCHLAREAISQPPPAAADGPWILAIGM